MKQASQIVKLRDDGVESLRVLLMFGICLLHSISQCGHYNRWIAQPLLACVDAFVFISGYYGIRFKPSKLLRLYVVGAVCAFISAVLPALAGLAEYPTLKECWKTYISYSWFLHAYAVMMLLSPLVDIKKGFLGLWTVLFLVFCWAGLCAVPYVGSIFPMSSGITAYSGITLFGIYVAARLFRFYSLDKRFDKRKTCVVLIVLYAMAVRGWAEYSTPVALGLAAIMFTYGRKLHLGKFGQLIAPSTFAIYMLHSNRHFFVIMRYIEDLLLSMGVPLILAYLAVASITFFGCTLIDGRSS